MLDQCHGSLEEARKLLPELKRKALATGSTSLDKRKHFVLQKLCKQLQKKDTKKAALPTQKEGTYTLGHWHDGWFCICNNLCVMMYTVTVRAYTCIIIEHCAILVQ